MGYFVDTRPAASSHAQGSVNADLGTLPKGFGRAQLQHDGFCLVHEAMLRHKMRVLQESVIGQDI